MALCLAAGLDGIENQLEAPEPIGKNMYLLTEEQIAGMNIDVLPATLGEACDAFEQDTYIQEVLGEHISKKYLEAKKAEWADYRAQVTEWAFAQYLYKISAAAGLDFEQYYCCISQTGDSPKPEENFAAEWISCGCSLLYRFPGTAECH